MTIYSSAVLHSPFQLIDGEGIINILHLGVGTGSIKVFICSLLCSTYKVSRSITNYHFPRHFHTANPSPHPLLLLKDLFIIFTAS